MGTTFRTVSTFSTKVTALNDTATELSRSLLDTQAIIRRIDTVARTSYLPQWEERREDFRRMLEMSERAAIKFSATIRYYLSLQEETNDPAEVEETIQEVSAFRKNLPQLSLDQRTEFGHLDTSLDKLEQEIFSTVRAQRNSISNEVDNMAGHITSLEEELTRLYKKRRQRQYEEVLDGAIDLWNNGSNLFNAERRVAIQYTTQLTHASVMPRIRAQADAPTRPLVEEHNIVEEDLDLEDHIVDIKADIRELRWKLSRGESELEEYENLDVDQLRDRIHEIRRNLAEQSELQEDIFLGVKARLTDESERYLQALQRGHIDLSPKGQLAYRNAKQRILSSSVVWERKAEVLVDEYAKKLK